MKTPGLKQWSAALASLALALVLGELLLRLWRPDIGRRGFADARLGWTTREYADFDPEAEPPGERLRLMVLGDSYLAGVNVRQMRERFPTYLADRHPDQLEARILAAAGWGPDQELLAFLEKGAPWRPDLVILAFCANNDLINITTNRHSGVPRKPYFVVEDDRLALFGPLGDPLAWGDRHPARSPLRQSYLLDFVRGAFGGEAAVQAASDERVDSRYKLFEGIGDGSRIDEVKALGPRLSWSPQNGVNDVNAYIGEDFELNSYQWKLLRGIVRELRDRVVEAGGELVLMALPTPYEARDLRLTPGSGFEHEFQTPDGPFTFRVDEPARRLGRICDELDLDLFDPTAAFVKRVEEESLVDRTWPDPLNRHFGRVGHMILAEELERFLAARGQLRVPESSAPREVPHGGQ